MNFISQLLDPRGRSLADRNTQSGANIVIYGKDWVKERRSKGRLRAHGSPECENNQKHEPLHCSITANTHEKIIKVENLVLGQH
jgi:hypothetical protein